VIEVLELADVFAIQDEIAAMRRPYAVRINLDLFHVSWDRMGWCARSIGVRSRRPSCSGT
jgi:hypothetical protein